MHYVPTAAANSAPITLAVAPRARAGLLLGFAIAAACPPLTGQSAIADTTVRIQIEGLRGEERRNALATMSIALAASERRVGEARLRRLHARVPDEIALALQPFGYYRPEVLRIDRTTWIARYVVDPGARVVVRSVAIDITGDGAGDARFRQAIEAFPAREGAPLSHVAYELGKTSLLDAASELGYLTSQSGRSAASALPFVHTTIEHLPYIGTYMYDPS